jgi:hypothetical protein
MKDTMLSATIVRVAVTAVSAIALGGLLVWAGYWYGQRSVRSRYEIWWSTSGAFERESVRAIQTAKILSEYKGGHTNGSAEVTILAQLRTSLGIIDSFVPLASDIDRRLAYRLATSLSTNIGPFVPTNATFSKWKEAHHAYIYREIQERLESIRKESTNGTPML